MGLVERKAARAAARAKEEAAPAPEVIKSVPGESPDDLAGAKSQTDLQLFRDDAARAKAAAEINEARANWANGPGKILARGSK